MTQYRFIFAMNWDNRNLVRSQIFRFVSLLILEIWQHRIYSKSFWMCESYINTDVRFPRNVLHVGSSFCLEWNILFFFNELGVSYTSENHSGIVTVSDVEFIFLFRGLIKLIGNSGKYEYLIKKL